MIEPKEGLWIKSVDGEVFKIDYICNCEYCIKRGFSEPRLNDGSYIISEDDLKSYIASSYNPKDLVDNPLVFQYKNSYGHFNTKFVYGDTVRIRYGHTDKIKEDQWLMDGIDLDKGKFETFAMRDILNIK